MYVVPDMKGEGLLVGSKLQNMCFSEESSSDDGGLGSVGDGMDEVWGWWSEDDLEEAIEGEVRGLWRHMSSPHSSPRKPSEPEELSRGEAEASLAHLWAVISKEENRTKFNSYVTMIKGMASVFGWLKELEGWEMLPWASKVYREAPEFPVVDNARLSRPVVGEGRTHRRIKRTMEWRLENTYGPQRVKPTEDFHMAWTFVTGKPCSGVLLPLPVWGKVILLCRHPRWVNWLSVPDALRDGGWMELSKGWYLHEPP
jgi:hypothetical protein